MDTYSNVIAQSSYLVSDGRGSNAPHTSTDSFTITGYDPAIKSITDYYPFGMQMPDRCYSDGTTHVTNISAVTTVPVHHMVNRVWPDGRDSSIGGAIILTGSSPLGLVASGLEALSYELPRYIGGLLHTVRIFTHGTVPPGFRAEISIGGTGPTAFSGISTDLTYTTVPGSAFVPYLHIYNLGMHDTIFIDSVHIDSATYEPYHVLSSISSSDGYAYGYNGKFKDNEIAGVGNSLDYGNRMLDTRIGRFWSLDKYMHKYPSQSPFVYAANSPIGAKDVNGDYVYILACTANNSKHGGDRMFKAAALTRAYDITHSKGFDAKRDVVAVIAVTDLAKLAQQVQSVVATNSPKYGGTKEFGLWSHSASKDGAIGSVATSIDAAAGAPNQMSMAGWGKINFNWSGDGNVAGFYGCNGGNPNNAYGQSFGTRLSGLSNFSGVSVLGQPGSSFPSKYTDERNEVFYQASGDYLPVESMQGRSELPILQKTYLVSGTKGQGWQALFWSTPAAPMQVSVNGQPVGTQPQAGTPANPIAVPQTPPSPASGQ